MSVAKWIPLATIPINKPKGPIFISWVHACPTCTVCARAWPQAYVSSARYTLRHIFLHIAWTHVVHAGETLRVNNMRARSSKTLRAHTHTHRLSRQIPVYTNQGWPATFIIIMVCSLCICCFSCNNNGSKKKMHVCATSARTHIGATNTHKLVAVALNLWGFGWNTILCRARTQRAVVV